MEGFHFKGVRVVVPAFKRLGLERTLPPRDIQPQEAYTCVEFVLERRGEGYELWCDRCRNWLTPVLRRHDGWQCEVALANIREHANTCGLIHE